MVVFTVQKVNERWTRFGVESNYNKTLQSDSVA